MSSESPDIETILAEAVEISAAPARQEFVEQACGGDTGLVAMVNRLIDNHFRAGNFLDLPILPVSIATLPPACLEVPGTMIGPYKLREVLGEGGMGVVYVAEQERPVRRKVALKIIKPGMDTREVLARFEAERQALALMEHPNIARVLDAGATESGRPYFVMELVRGIPITEYCEQNSLCSRERMELFGQVCLAIEHAHQKGIIHRDVKPSNVMITLQDGLSMPKVIDFGVAKAVNQRLTEQTIYTRFSEMIGTPLYMSPEQAEISAADVDTRSDVYSLGVLLYELLTGTTPFDPDRFRSTSLDEMRRMIREDDPLRPSARVTTLQATCTATCPRCRGTPRKLVEVLSGELDWIVMKALEKDRNRRYQSARAFADDVERFVRNEAVEACPPSVTYRLRKFASRHKTFLVTLTLIFALLLASTAVSGWLAMQAIYARRVADERLEGERRARSEATARQMALRQELYATDVNLAWRFWSEGDSRRSLDLMDRYQESEVRGFEWQYLSNCAQPNLRTLTGHAAPILTADVSPDDRMIVSADLSGAVMAWDLASGRELETLRYGTQEVCCVRFSPDGRLLATAGQDRMIHLWDVASWTEMSQLSGHDMTICSVAWSPDGKQLVSAARDHSVRLWDVENQSELRLLSGHSDVVRCVAWSGDGKLVASGGADMVVRLWDTNTWQPAGELLGHNEGLLAIAFSPDNRWLASAGYNTSLIVHDVNERKVWARIPEAGNIWSLAYSPDSRLLGVGRNEGRVSLYQLHEREKELTPLHTTIDFTGAIRSVAFVENGEILVMASEEDRVIALENVNALTGRGARLFPERCLAVDLDRDLAATADASGSVLLRGFREDNLQKRIEAHTATVLDVAFSPRTGILASCSADGSVCLSSTETGQVLHRLEIPEPLIAHLAFSSDGQWLAGGSTLGKVILWRVSTGQLVHSLRPGLEPAATQVAFSSDSSLLAAGNYGKVILCEVSTGRARANLAGTRLGVYGLAFNPDDTLLAVGGDGYITLWDLETRRESATLAGHHGGVFGLAFSPDGRTLASLAGDQTVRLWHMATRRELFTLLQSGQPLGWLEFASSRSLLVGVSSDDQSSNEVLVFGANR